MSGMYSIYCDGSSCGKKNGAIGYGYIILKDGEQIAQHSDGHPDGTNNQAELMAAITGIVYLLNLPDRDKSCRIEIVSDSQYVVHLADGKFSPKKNLVLAQALRKLCQLHNISSRWVRGHNGHAINEKCDILAKSGKDRYKKNGKKNN